MEANREVDMGRSSVLVELTGAQESRLKEFIKGSRSHLERRRAQAVLFLHGGMLEREAAELVGVSERAVRRWLRVWRREGLAGLKDRKRPGRESRIMRQYGEKLVTITRQSPESVGMKGGSWNCRMLCQWLEGTFHVKVSDEWVRQILLRHGLRFRRARLKLTSPDCEYAQKKRLWTN